MSSYAPPTDKMYTGHQREGQTSGLYYAQARFYSADLGRFLSPDSIVPGAGNPQALNVVGEPDVRRDCTDRSCALCFRNC